MGNLASRRILVDFNGHAGSPPVQPLIEELRRLKVGELITLRHPLSRAHGRAHEMNVYRDGLLTDSRSWQSPIPPPASFLLDGLYPVRLPRVDVWVGMNPLSAYRGLLRKRFGRAGRVVYWAIDYSPRRFASSPAETLYRHFEEQSCLQADLRIELSARAAHARQESLGFEARTTAAPCLVLPIGVDRQDVARGRSEHPRPLNLVFAGSLDERNGAHLLIPLVQDVKTQFPSCHLTVIGRGPLQEVIRESINRFQLDRHVTLVGFLESHSAVTDLLRQAQIGLAPYTNLGNNSFTQFADPSKIKDYLAAGLPVISTPETPIANLLEEREAGVICEPKPQTLADAVVALLSDEPRLHRYSRRAVDLAAEYTWDTLLQPLVNFISHPDDWQIE